MRIRALAGGLFAALLLVLAGGHWLKRPFVVPAAAEPPPALLAQLPACSATLPA